MAEKDSYILYDSTSMQIVSPKDRQVLGSRSRISSRELTRASVPGMRMRISDVTVNFEKLGRGEPCSAWRRRSTGSPRTTSVAARAPVNRNSTEHVVQDFWMADEQKGSRQLRSRACTAHAAGSGFGELLTQDGRGAGGWAAASRSRP